MATTVEFTIPSIEQVTQLSSAHLLVGITLLGTAIITSIVVEVIKRRYSAGEREKMAKRYVALLLTAVSSLFTFLSYFIVLAQENASLLSGLPFVEKHFMTVVGIAFVLYSVKFNKVYVIVSDRLSKWASKSDSKQAEVQVAPVQLQPAVVTDPNQFV